jgi:ABC-type uncharacterized transport system ATPase subunit
MTPSAVTLNGIVKRFGPVTALGGVSVEVQSGEIHALLGENGAGKSTLMKVLGGFLAADEGEILVRGERADLRSPREALDHGIGMVHQHFRLVDRFTAAENLALRHGGGPRLLDRRALRGRAEELIDEFGLRVPLEVPVYQLSLGEQQRVEILRMLACGADVLILDEPTAVLTPQESDELGAVLRRLAQAGRAVVFISHKIREILEFADRATVLRRGATVGTIPRSACDAQTLGAMMFGEASPSDALGESRPTRRPRSEGPIALAAVGLHVDGDRGLSAVRDLSLSVHQGEIVGIAGVAGNGQVELAEALVGLRPPVQGEITVAGASLAGQPPRAFTRAGVAYIPEDRLSMGLSPGDPIWRNVILKRYDRAPVAWGPFVRRRQAKQIAAQLSADVRLSTDDVGTPVQQLSGGNAQKLLVGRELEVGRRALVAVNPTQGLDISAVSQVWQLLEDARTSGVGTLLISSELDEVLALSDRILVLFEGRFVGEFAAADADRDKIGLLMAGHGVGAEAVHG